MTLKIGSRSPNSDQIVYLFPMMQYVKLGLNPSFGSRDRVRCRQAFVELKFDIQSAEVT